MKKSLLPHVCLTAMLAFSVAPIHATAGKGDENPQTTHLFWNWGKVDAGNTEFFLDRHHVSEESIRMIEQVRDHYKRAARISLADKPTAPNRFNTAFGVRITIEKAEKVGPWLKPDKPWEKLGFNQMGKVLWDQGKYRLWYMCMMGRGRVIEVTDERRKLDYDIIMCYAESTDGINWIKPELGLVEFQGSKRNNIVSKDQRIVQGTVFIDPSAPPEERYKIVTPTSLRSLKPESNAGTAILAGAVSSDGLRWKYLPEPLWTGHTSDTFSGVIYDEQLEKYVGFFRTSNGRRRSIGRSETTDFAHWPIPTTILTPGTEELPSDDFYSNAYSRYPGVPESHLILTAVFHRDTSSLDVRLATSLDGIAWNWTCREPIIERGEPGAWDGGSLYANSELVRLGDNQVAVALTGYSHLHNEFWHNYFYESSFKQSQGLGWAVWQDGRLAGIEARHQGEFTTLPLSASGNEIQINLRTSQSGSAQVELIVEEDDTTKIYRSEKLYGDHLWTNLSWVDPVDLSTLAGKKIRLRVKIYDAKVFGVRL